MAKIKHETTRYEVMSPSTGEARTVIQTHYLRSERTGRAYRDKPLRVCATPLAAKWKPSARAFATANPVRSWFELGKRRARSSLRSPSAI